jgi:hypothetical protein
MSQEMTQEQFAAFLRESLEQIRTLHAEVDEVQAAFNSVYLGLKANHDATLSRLTHEILDRRHELPAPLIPLITAQLDEERIRLQERREQLKQQVPAQQRKVDTVQRKAQEHIDRLRTLNPQYDQREEQLKTTIEQNRSDIADLDEHIKHLRRGLGFILNYTKIDEADKTRSRLAGQLESRRAQLDEVRKDWIKQRESLLDDAELRAEWQALTLELATMRADLNNRSDDARLERLALRRAAFAVLDRLDDPALCSGPLADKLHEMLTLNQQTDRYSAGLQAVAGLIALLGAVAEGMESLQETTDKLITQQKAHSDHLRPLLLVVSDQVIAFHQHWQPLREQVRDEARAREAPLEFVAAVQPTLDQHLTDTNIGAMFDDLGTTIKQATQFWG